MHRKEERGKRKAQRAALLRAAGFFSLSTLLFSLTPAPGGASALDDDREQPLRINARHVELDQRTGLALYRGDVIVTQGSLEIRAERLEVHARAGRAERLRAWGTPARVRMRPQGETEDVRLFALQIDYRVDARVAELTGEAIIEQGPNRFLAPRARFDLANQSAEAGGAPGAEGGGRVSAVYHPPAASTP
jgi:lipopolysaccharide export system protein LptA